MYEKAYGLAGILSLPIYLLQNGPIELADCGGGRGGVRDRTDVGISPYGYGLDFPDGKVI